MSFPFRRRARGFARKRVKPVYKWDAAILTNGTLTTTGFVASDVVLASDYKTGVLRAEALLYRIRGGVAFNITTTNASFLVRLGLVLMDQDIATSNASHDPNAVGNLIDERWLWLETAFIDDNAGHIGNLNVPCDVRVKAKLEDANIRFVVGVQAVTGTTPSMRYDATFRALLGRIDR